MLRIPFPFTLFTLVLVAATGFFTGSHRGPLSETWLQRLGFAPQDLWEGKLLRLFLSVFATESTAALWQAMVMIAAAVGGAEYLFGTWPAAAIFWGVHVVTLLLTSLAAALTRHLFRIPFAEGLLLIRDVGASAGYFGCLGAVMPGLEGFLPGPHALAPVILLVLTGVFLRTLRVHPKAGARLYSDLCHAVAFALGWRLVSPG